MPTFKFRYENSGNHQNTFAKFKAKHVDIHSPVTTTTFFSSYQRFQLCVYYWRLCLTVELCLQLLQCHIYIYIYTHIYISLFRFSKKKISLFYTFDFASLSHAIEISIKRSELQYQSIRYRLRERKRDSKKERKRLNIWLKQPKTQSFASSFSF